MSGKRGGEAPITPAVLRTRKDAMTLGELKSKATAICGTLRVPPVTIDFYRATNSTYWPHNNHIRLARNAARGHIASFLHQLAHHVAAQRGYGPTYHDNEFASCLFEVVGLWYDGATDKYPWDTERFTSTMPKEEI